MHAKSQMRERFCLVSVHSYAMYIICNANYINLIMIIHINLYIQYYSITSYASSTIIPNSFTLVVLSVSPLVTALYLCKKISVVCLIAI